LLRLAHASHCQSGRCGAAGHVGKEWRWIGFFHAWPIERDLQPGGGTEFSEGQMIAASAAVAMALCRVSQVASPVRRVRREQPERLLNLDPGGLHEMRCGNRSVELRLGQHQKRKHEYDAQNERHAAGDQDTGSSRLR
jgi:hypothetical protein